MTTKSIFKTLSVINVNEYTENKGKFTYLSWAFAWQKLLSNFPTATRTVYENPVTGLPYWEDNKGVIVKVGVTINDIEHISYLPVMDMRNNAKKPEQSTMMDVNKAIQRATVKAISLHGLGLYIYAGEDLPSPDLLPHDKSWEKDRAGFCAELRKVDMTYDDVVIFCEKLKQPRPSQMDRARRLKLLTHLQKEKQNGRHTTTAK